MVAHFVRGEGHLVIALGPVGEQFSLMHILREIEFTADDRVDAVGLGVLVEFNGPVQDPVIGDREGLHVHLPCGLHGLLDLHRAVEEAVAGVKMEVTELLLTHGVSLAEETPKGEP